MQTNKLLTDREIEDVTFLDAFQHFEIAQNRRKSVDAQIDAKTALRSINELEEKVDRLSLLCHALFEELERATGFSEIQLKEKMTQIDLRDGRKDRKYDPVMGAECPDCGRQVKKTGKTVFGVVQAFNPWHRRTLLTSAGTATPTTLRLWLHSAGAHAASVIAPPECSLCDLRLRRKRWGSV